MKGLQAAGKAGAGAESDEITPHPGCAVRVQGDQGLGCKLGNTHPPLL